MKRVDEEVMAFLPPLEISVPKLGKKWGRRSIGLDDKQSLLRGKKFQTDKGEIKKMANVRSMFKEVAREWIRVIQVVWICSLRGKHPVLPEFFH